MPYFTSYREAWGYTPVVTPETGGLRFIELGILRLRPGEGYHVESGSRETALIVLSGRCAVEAGGSRFDGVGERVSVFEGNAHGVYSPAGVPLRVEAVTPLEAALAFAPGEGGGHPVHVRPEENYARTVGKHTWTRLVRDVIGKNVAAEKLFVGETVNEPGNWSSYPPHRHDVDNPPEEVDMEEVYFFKVDPPQGFGFQRVYTGDGRVDEAFVIKHNTAVSLPEGYHPVAAAGGYRVYYLWVLAGMRRELCPREDPDHAWVNGL